MNISNSLGRVLNSIQSSHSEQIVLQNLLYPVTLPNKSYQNLVDKFLLSFPTPTEPSDQLYASNKQENHLLRSTR